MTLRTCAKAGITNINVDLIAGLPHQTAESWEFSVSETIACGAPHASVYMLEVDEDSRLGRELIAGGTKYHAHFVPDEDLTADLYIAACARLESAGIKQYEISNFAREGFESRHNLKYWTRQPYLGFGVDAHSMLNALSSTGEGHGLSRAVKTPNDSGFSPWAAAAVRFATQIHWKRISQAERSAHPHLDETALEECFFLGLRLNQGINLREVAREFREDQIANFAPIIAELVEINLLERDADVIRLTPRGRLLSNEVFERFIALTV